MKDATFEKRMHKVNVLKEELLKWQQVVVAQREQQIIMEQRLIRIELNFSALMATLNAQSPFRKFDNKRMAAELEAMIKAAHKQLTENGNAPTSGPAQAEPSAG